MIHKLAIVTKLSKPVKCGTSGVRSGDAAATHAPEASKSPIKYRFLSAWNPPRRIFQSSCQVTDYDAGAAIRACSPSKYCEKYMAAMTK